MQSIFWGWIEINRGVLIEEGALTEGVQYFSKNVKPVRLYRNFFSLYAYYFLESLSSRKVIERISFCENKT